MLSYLALANRYDDLTWTTDSEIYRWNGTGFALFQSIPTVGANDWEFFEIAGTAYLAVANSQTNMYKFRIDSKIYKWDGSWFAEFQSVEGVRAYDFEAFEIAGIQYLALAHAASPYQS